MHRGAERPLKGRATERVTVRRTCLCRRATAVAAYRAATAVPATAVAAYIPEVAECDIALVSCSPARTLSGGLKIKVIEGKSQSGLRLL